MKMKQLLEKKEIDKSLFSNLPSLTETSTPTGRENYSAEGFEYQALDSSKQRELR